MVFCHFSSENSASAAPLTYFLIILIVIRALWGFFFLAGGRKGKIRYNILSGNITVSVIQSYKMSKKLKRIYLVKAAGG